MDRKSSPKLSSYGNLRLPAYKKHQISNGIEVYELSMGTQDVLKLELVFDAGRPFEEKKLVARATNTLIKEGTSKLTGAQIAESIDFYGSSLSTPVSLDHGNLVIYCLKKHFEAILKIVSEVLTDPVFPESDLQLFIESSIKRFEVDQERGDVIAYRALTEDLFGVDHPYGYNSSNELYRALEKRDLKLHHKRTYNASNCVMFLAGNTDENCILLLDKYLGKSIDKGIKSSPIISGEIPAIRKRQISKPNSLQSSIRLGRKLFNRAHEDFKGLYVLNTLLGGFFGSRLMRNIREEKGLTYNIFSSLDTMTYDGYLYIGSEVDNENVDKVREEIYKEMKNLRTQVIPNDELQMLKNYLKGNILSMIDGPINTEEVLKVYVCDGVPLEHFDHLVQYIDSCTAEDLMALARTYLDEKDFCEVVVGK